MGGAAEVGDSEAGLALDCRRSRKGAIVANHEFPNRCRADSALVIYRDAMRQYIAPILEEKRGPDWFVDQVLKNRATDRRSIDSRQSLMRTGTPLRDLIDLSEIHRLLADNETLFVPPLRDSDFKRARLIKDLRNELQHAQHQPGDCAPREAREIANQCIAMLERLDLLDAAEQIRKL